MWRWWHHSLAILAVVLCASVPYLNSLEGKYAYDDKVRLYIVRTHALFQWTVRTSPRVNGESAAPPTHRNAGRSRGQP